MREIQLTKGKVTIVDNIDYMYLSRFSWYARESKKVGKAPIFYACRREGVRGDSRYFYMHREILERMGFKNFIQTDHKNRNSLDNTRENLRPATSSQNNSNMNSKIGKSGYRGVVRLSGNLEKPFRALLSVNGRTLHVGYFATSKEAAMAYDVAARKYRGEFALVNFKK